jgi:PPIC-type PPIASE domain/SurA N-terminal domain
MRASMSMGASMSTNSGAGEASWRDFREVNVRRSIFLMAGGALLGLSLAGYSLFTARGTSTLRVPPEDVALVNQQPISRSDYLGELRTIYGVDLEHATAEQRSQVLGDMIREELLVQRGKELDLVSTVPEVRAALVTAVELEIAADAITSQPTESDLRAYYAAHRTRYASEGVMTLRDLVFAPGDRVAALQAAQALKTGAPTPALLARWRAKESEKVGDEEFYFAAKIHLGARLFAVAQSLPDGSTSPPIELPDGIHVLYMFKNQRPSPFDFPAARDQVLNDYRNESIAHLRAGDESFLRKRANVQIADDLR